MAKFGKAFIKHFTIALLVIPLTIDCVHAANTAPSLLQPVDKSKNITKESITFSWKKPANIDDSKILGYRLLISSSSQFSGYRSQLDECDSHCSVHILEANQTKSIAEVERLKSVYFWKVQAITPTGAARWSKIYSFKTTAKVDSGFTGEHLFNYTKIANDGSELPAEAILGANPKDWACTRDNSTGLMWEVKTDDDGLRDKDSTYSWYEPDEAKNGGNAGKKRSYEYANWCKGSECDINDYTQTVNASRLCGAKDWRMPSKNELVGLIYCSDEQYDLESGECVNSKISTPTIDKTYFPNTEPTNTDLDSVYWSFSTNPMNPEYASNVIFTDGTSYGATKIGDYYVRLVRNAR